MSGIVRLAHDSGDGMTVAHCPFDGGGQVIGRSDGTIECQYCGTAFTVQVQPMFSGFPQTVNGMPFPIPGMPGQIGGPPPAPGAEEPMPFGAEPEDDGNPFAQGEQDGDQGEQAPPFGDEGDAAPDDDGGEAPAPKKDEVIEVLRGDGFEERKVRAKDGQ